MACMVYLPNKNILPIKINHRPMVSVNIPTIPRPMDPPSWEFEQKIWSINTPPSRHTGPALGQPTQKWMALKVVFSPSLKITFFCVQVNVGNKIEAFQCTHFFLR